MTEIATRDAYGKKLATLGEIYPEIVVLDADLSGSTKTEFFAKKFPQRFFNMGVAEQDLMGTAAGLAACGKTVFVSTFAIFATGRAWEPFRQSIAYPHLNVKICASHAGLSVGEDGASHQTVEDIAIIRAIPFVKVLVPSDGIETEQMVEFLAKDSGPCYLRLSRAKAPLVHEASYQFQIGRGHILKEGSTVCLFTAGFITSQVLAAALELSNQGVSTTVVNMSSIKPLDSKLVVAMAEKHQYLFSIEEHSIIGGLGSAIAETLVSSYPKKLVRLGINDEFGQSGSYQAVIDHYGLSTRGILESLKKELKL